MGSNFIEAEVPHRHDLLIEQGDELAGDAQGCIEVAFVAGVPVTKCETIHRPSGAASPVGVHAAAAVVIAVGGFAGFKIESERVEH